jgi:KaiC/GvpD/RAD55 family RecA-like ATPase
MYSFADVLPDEEVEPGTNLLVSGPPMTGKRGVALQLLADGTEAGQGSVVVSTKDSADRILSEYAECTDVENAPIGVVDCVTRQQGVGEPSGDDRVKYASSPVDMTGIGIHLSEFLETFYRERDLRRNRVLLYSLSTMLMYSDVETVFRFLHVFTGRIQSADALGLHVLDATAHDEQTMNTLKQLFDGVVVVERDGNDEPDVSLHGPG